jgi:hypothetical protein
MTHVTSKNQPCCPRFDPAPWDGKTHVWKDKPFIMESMPEFMHMPFPPMIAKAMGKMWKAAQDAGAAPELKDFMCLAYDPSPWKGELYVAVTKEVQSAKNVKLSGTFMSKVFDGPYNAVPKWIKEMDKYLSGQGKKASRYYFYYTTCPKCAKIHGHNYVVAFARVD